MPTQSALRRDPSLLSHPTWGFRSACEADMRYIAPRLTREAKDEIDALSKFQPVSVLLKDMSHKAVFIDAGNPNQPVALFEIHPTDTGNGYAFWSALTDSVAASSHFWSLTEYARTALNQLQSRLYPTLTTFVDARNVRQIGWLESVGFNHVEDVPQYGRKELPFKIYKRLAR